MNDFTKEIQEYKTSGNYVYSPDKNGNYIFINDSNVFTKTYISLPLINLSYNTSKIISFSDVNFNEYTTGSIKTYDSGSTVIIEDVQSELDFYKQKSENLQQQIDSYITQSNMYTETEADILAVKQVILNLRKLNGEGRVDSDFSDTFPYTAIKKTT